MRVADLVLKKGKRVKVRIPTRLKESFGKKETVTGVVQTIRKDGITWVKVKIGAKVYDLRPQDLS